MSELKFVKTVCRSCHGGCGVIAHVKDGKVVKVEGDPSSPISHGSMCSKGLAITQLAYHPDRVLYPMKKTAAGWNRISWDDALDTVTAKFKQVVADYGPESRLLIACRAKHGHGRFLQLDWVSSGARSHLGSEGDDRDAPRTPLRELAGPDGSEARSRPSHGGGTFVRKERREHLHGKRKVLTVRIHQAKPLPVAARDLGPSPFVGIDECVAPEGPEGHGSLGRSEGVLRSAGVQIRKAGDDRAHECSLFFGRFVVW